MYMYYLLGYRIMQLNVSEERKMVIAQNTYLLALDGDIDFRPKAAHALIERMKIDAELGAACGRIHPIGKGPMVWYQVFEYAIGHWLQKATEHVLGCILCSPGCFSLYRGRALMENSVIKRYTTTSERAIEYVKYDQGEDRWLCTLLLKQKFRVEYSAASDAYTHAPEGFNEFYNQRRRWVPSTMANIFDLLVDSPQIVKTNNSFSMLYVSYLVMVMFGTIFGPGTIFLMLVGAITAVFDIDIWTSFLWNLVPVTIFILVCVFFKQNHQLMAAFIISAVYSLIMMAVMVGVVMQIVEDGVLHPYSLFFLFVVITNIITGILHPREILALPTGLIYYIAIPSMFMFLVLYSLFNMNDISWGTRENAKVNANKKNDDDEKIKEGTFDISCNGLFRCIFCTNPNISRYDTNELLSVNSSLNELNSKIRDLEL